MELSRLEKSLLEDKHPKYAISSEHIEAQFDREEGKLVSRNVYLLNQLCDSNTNVNSGKCICHTTKVSFTDVKKDKTKSTTDSPKCTFNYGCIRIGDEYQATIPDLILPENARSIPELSKVVWSPYGDCISDNACTYVKPNRVGLSYLTRAYYERAIFVEDELEEVLPECPNKIISHAFDQLYKNETFVCTSLVDSFMYNLHSFSGEGQMLQFADFKRSFEISEIGPGKKLQKLKAKVIKMQIKMRREQQRLKEKEIRVMDSLKEQMMKYETFVEERQANPEWCPYEIILFIAAYEEHGSNYKKIANELKTKNEIQVEQFFSRHRQFVETISSMPDDIGRHTYLKQYMRDHTQRQIWNSSTIISTNDLVDQIESPPTSPSSDLSGVFLFDDSFSDSSVDMFKFPAPHSSSDEYVESKSEDDGIMEINQKLEPMPIDYEQKENERMTIVNDVNSLDESSIPEEVIYKTQIDKRVNSVIQWNPKLTEGSSSFMLVSSLPPRSPILSPPSMCNINQSNEPQSQTVANHVNVLALTSQLEPKLDQPLKHSMNEEPQCNTYMSIDSPKPTYESLYVHLEVNFNAVTHVVISAPTPIQKPMPKHTNLSVHPKTCTHAPTAAYSNAPDHAPRSNQVPLNVNAQTFEKALPNHAQMARPLYENYQMSAQEFHLEGILHSIPTCESLQTHSHVPNYANPNFATLSQVPFKAHKHNTPSCEPTYSTRIQMPSQALHSHIATYESTHQSQTPTHAPTHVNVPVITHTSTYASTSAISNVHIPAFTTFTQVPFDEDACKPIHETLTTRTQKEHTHGPSQNQILLNSTFSVNSQIPTSSSKPANEAVAQKCAPVIRHTQAPSASILKQALTNKFNSNTKLSTEPVSSSPHVNQFTNIAHEAQPEHMHSSAQALAPQQIEEPRLILSNQSQSSATTKMSGKCANRIKLTKAGIKIGVLDKLLRKSQIGRNLYKTDSPMSV